MNAIALVQTQDKDINQLQQNISQAINPVIQNPIISGNILVQQQLQPGINQVDHQLGRKLQGWFLVRKRASSDIYDIQDSNRTPAATLALQASLAVSVDIYVF